MTTPNGFHPKTEEVAEWLVAFEAADDGASAADKPETCLVCEKIRRRLGSLAGSVGYRTLLARALTLAKRQDSVLGPVQVEKDGSLKGFRFEEREANVALIAQLLGLLYVLIGEPLTLQLLREIWPDLPGSEADFAKEEQI